ncbi:putative RiPP precursor [Rhodobacter sp. CZR27]|uniref:putative RiPP precursor n=1 Tax=Rhodobacter sp. CZR27 TaxID=2033869 RepID=UPI001E5E4CFC|nr:putative RiPP precursor [Rhodobacter sp. CZR27]
MRKDIDETVPVYEAPLLRVHGTLEEMTHGGRGRGHGHGWPHRRDDPCDYTFS